MAKVMCVWELGANLGHLANLRRFAEVALGQGHEVYMVLRELQHSPKVLSDLPVHYLQAPYRRSNLGNPKPFLCYSQLIRHYCFADAEELKVFISAWRQLFFSVSPDLVIYDHSPTALIASLGLSFKKAIIGSGFITPPTERPFFGVFPDVQRDKPRLAAITASEKSLIDDINRCYTLLDSTSVAIKQIAEVYRQADVVFRTTLPELDHFGSRPGARYLGGGRSFAQQRPVWPDKGELKAFAYLQRFKDLPELLNALEANDIGALIYIRDLSSEEQKRWCSDYIHFTSKPVDLQVVAQQADFAITHGNHDSTAQLLMAGIPQLLIPRHQEQFYLALRLKQLGCALLGFQDQGSFREEIHSLKQGRGRQQALAVQQKYQDFSVEESNHYISSTLAGLLS